MNHPCKIYNVLAVNAPVIYIGPTPSHVTEVLDAIGNGRSQARVQHGDADKLANEIRRLAAQPRDKRASWPPALLAGSSNRTLLPKMISVIEGTRPGALPAATNAVLK